MKIYKYKLNETHLNEADVYHLTVELPFRAKILKYGFQSDGLYVWALIDESNKTLFKHDYTIFGTGWDIESVEKLDYIDTLFVGRLVWHLFEDRS